MMYTERMKDATCQVDGCESAIRNRKLQLCNRHYLRFKRHGDVHSVESAYLNRFEDKIDKTGDCWLWQGAKNVNGYGTIQRAGKRLYAHRVSYETYVGPISEGAVIDHLCRVHACVRPEHLEAVQQHTNVLRGVGPTAVNASKVKCIRGHLLNGDNLYIIQATGYRQCKTCNKIRRMRKNDSH